MDKIWRPFAHLEGESSKPKEQPSSIPEVPALPCYSIGQPSHAALQPGYFLYQVPVNYPLGFVTQQSLSPYREDDSSSVTSSSSRPPSVSSVSLSLAGSLTDTDSQSSWDSGFSSSVTSPLDRDTPIDLSRRGSLSDTYHPYQSFPQYDNHLVSPKFYMASQMTNYMPTPVLHRHTYATTQQPQHGRTKSQAKRQQHSQHHDDVTPPSKRSRVAADPKQFQCPSCTRSFAHRSTLTKHQRTHTGFRPHVCPTCSRSFTQSGNMLRHMRKVHGHTA